jgi:hypothetical protein
MVSKKSKRLRAAKSAGDAGAGVRWDFCRLDFLLLFDQAKRRRRNENVKMINL